MLKTKLPHLTAADRLIVRAGMKSSSSGVLLVVGTAVGMATTLLVPTALARATDSVLHHRSVVAPVLWLAILLLSAVVSSVVSAFAGYAAHARGTAWLQHSLIRHLLDLGIRTGDRFSPGDATSRLLDNTQATAGAASTALSVTANLVTSCGGLIALWLIDWRLGAMFVVAAAPAMWLMRRSMSGATDRFTHYQQAQGQIASRLASALSGIRTIRAAGSTHREAERVLGPLSELSQAGAATWTFQQRITWRFDLCLVAMELSVLGVAGWEVSAGRLSAGGWLAVVAFTEMAVGVLNSIDSLVGIAQSRAAAGRVNEILATATGRRPAGSLQLPDGAGTIEFRQVSVRVDGEQLLEDLDLEIPAGCTTAVVGRSGAGKTTLGWLVGGLIEPDAGQVLLDGVPLVSIAPQQLRGAIAYAFARPAVLGRTIADDISYGCASTERADIERAASAAFADDFIRRLPDAYDTAMVDARFSGGEYQRLGIARALLPQARLLVLDDATSSLDTVTELRVSTALAQHRPGQTRVIIAHRVTTAARADLVVWLDAGSVRAVAPHQVLWSDPAYRRVFQAETEDSSAAALAAGAREAVQGR